MQRKLLIVLIVIVIGGALFGLYKKGILFAPTVYPVLSDPSKKPATDVPALFSQAGTVIAISSAKITIRYTPIITATTLPLPGATGTLDPSTTISFPITSTTPVFSIVKDVADGKPILKEVPASLSDITIGANVAIQIPQKTLQSVAPLKIQIFPK